MKDKIRNLIQGASKGANAIVKPKRDLLDDAEDESVIDVAERDIAEESVQMAKIEPPKADKSFQEQVREFETAMLKSGWKCGLEPKGAEEPAGKGGIDIDATMRKFRGFYPNNSADEDRIRILLENGMSRFKAKDIKPLKERYKIMGGLHTHHMMQKGIIQVADTSIEVNEFGRSRINTYEISPRFIVYSKMSKYPKMSKEPSSFDNSKVIVCDRIEEPETPRVEREIPDELLLRLGRIEGLLHGLSVEITSEDRKRDMGKIIAEICRIGENVRGIESLKESLDELHDEIEGQKEELPREVADSMIDLNAKITSAGSGLNASKDDGTDEDMAYAKEKYFEKLSETNHESGDKDAFANRANNYVKILVKELNAHIDIGNLLREYLNLLWDVILGKYSVNETTLETIKSGLTEVLEEEGVVDLRE
jgi:hypothetical protein